MIIYGEIFKSFQKKKVKYVVVGGLALNLHGAMRNTADLDILVEMSDQNLKKIVTILKKYGYRVRQPIDPLGIADEKIRKEWVRKKHMKALNFFLDDGLKEVDLIIESPVSFEKARKEMFRLRIGNIVVPVVSLEHLILMKRKAGRAIDKVDIADLRRIKKLRGEK